MYPLPTGCSSVGRTSWDKQSLNIDELSSHAMSTPAASRISWQNIHRQSKNCPSFSAAPLHGPPLTLAMHVTHESRPRHLQCRGWGRRLGGDGYLWLITGMIVASTPSLVTKQPALGFDPWCWSLARGARRQQLERCAGRHLALHGQWEGHEGHVGRVGPRPSAVAALRTQERLSSSSRA